MDIGTVHYSKVSKSITGTGVGCWHSELACKYIYIYTPAYFRHVSDLTGLVLNYCPFYFFLPAGCYLGPLNR